MPGLVITTAGGSFGIGGSLPEPAAALTATSLSTTSLRISWGNSSDSQALTHLVERSANGTDWTTVAAAATSSPVDATGLSAATTYYIRVTASNIWGSAVPSETSGTTESEGAPTAPSGLVATALGSTSIGLAWVDNSNNETGFELQRATENTFASPTTLTPAANATAYTDTGRTASTQYFYRIRAVNGTGNSSYSSTADATTSSGGVTSFALTAVPDLDVGITATITPLFSTKWMWVVRTVVFGDSGFPSIVCGTHQNSGCAIYDRGTGWSYSDATSSYGISPNTTFGSVTGGLLFADIDHDGEIDWGHFGEGSTFDDYYYDAGTLTAASSTPWGSHTRINKLYEQDGTGYLEATFANWPDWPTSLTTSKRVMSWNGTSWAVTTGTYAPPSGIPSETLANMATYLYDGVTTPKPTSQRFIEYYYEPVDLTGDGTANDLVVQLFRSYSSAFRVWLLTNNGDGTYTEQNTSWGIPTGGGVAILPGQFGHHRPFGHNPGWIDAKNYDFAGTGRPDLFISTESTGAGHHGHYRWNGSSYTRLTSSPITARLGLSDAYAKRMYLVDLTNSGHLDIVLQRPRSGAYYIFLNNGSGTFTEYGSFRSWDSDGFDCIDLDGDGLPDFVNGGDGGADSGVTSSATARCLTIRENTTANPGNYLGIKLRRTGHANKFGVGAKIEVFEAGQSFAAAALIRRWYARPDGQALIFGVGSEATVDYRVTWPDATTSSATAVSVNQTITEDGA